MAAYATATSEAETGMRRDDSRGPVLDVRRSNTGGWLADDMLAVSLGSPTVRLSLEVLRESSSEP